MIKLEALHVEEIRGIRKLDIDFNKSTFVIFGPNGSGKSGVIDAIEFGLTGEMSRLSGRGTQGLSISEHGPHVDRSKFPDASFVELRVFLPAIKKTATIKRKVSAPHKPKIEPNDDDIKRVLAEVEEHPEIMLSRREVLRFILVEPSKRSEDIQTLLKLDDIGHTRAALNTAQNKLQTANKVAAGQMQEGRSALLRHLGIESAGSEDLLKVVNQRRIVLGLGTINELTASTKLDEGLGGAAGGLAFNKQSVLRDLKSLSTTLEDLLKSSSQDLATIVSDLARIEGDPALLDALLRRPLIEQGLSLLDGEECPLCDLPWPDERQLREHLTQKLARSEDARQVQQSLLSNGGLVAQRLSRLANSLATAQRVAEAEGDQAAIRSFSGWKADLDGLKLKLETVEGLRGIAGRLSNDWLQVPESFPQRLQSLLRTVEDKPDQSAVIDAQSFLVAAQVRLAEYRESMRKSAVADAALARAKLTYNTYCEVLEQELNALYDDVQEDFSTFYRFINEDDESKFTAKFTPTEGKLDLAVNFYDRGLFPPGAYHSEGHQDGMGVCLYLALMKRLFAERFTFALLDDVVMSVDTAHRHQFCRLLKQEFPQTQFVITTHDRLWAEQMKHAGLVTGKTSLAFNSWTVDSGPLVESSKGIWEEIDAFLSNGKVEQAAASLRRHLEYEAWHLADLLVAPVPFRADGNHELGDLLPAVISRFGTVLGQAIAAEQSWGNEEKKKEAMARRTAFSESKAAQNVEQWAINKAVHYNEWANFGKKDFQPVVTAFKELMECFLCGKCDSWLQVTPRMIPETLRCPCNGASLNLKPKPKN